LEVMGSMGGAILENVRVCFWDFFDGLSGVSKGQSVIPENFGRGRASNHKLSFFYAGIPRIVNLRLKERKARKFDFAGFF